MFVFDFIEICSGNCECECDRLQLFMPNMTRRFGDLGSVKVDTNEVIVKIQKKIGGGGGGRSGWM